MNRGKAVRYSTAGVSLLVLVSALLLALGIALSTTPSVRAATNSTENRKVAFWGDAHWGNGEGDGYQDDTRDAVDVIINKNPDMAFLLGDATSASSPQAWSQFRENESKIESQTGVPELYYLLGNHDGYQNVSEGSAHTVYAEGNGWSGVKHRMREDNKTSNFYAVEEGNNAFIVLSPIRIYDDGGTQISYSMLPVHVLNWLENMLSYYKSENYNTFVMSHMPIYHSNIATDNWPGVDDGDWQTTSDNLVNIFQKYPPDVYMCAHVHNDPDEYYSDNSEVAGGTVVWGSWHNANTTRSPALPDNTVFVQVPTVCYEHGGSAVSRNIATYPAVGFFTLVENQDYIRLEAENVMGGGTGTEVGWTENDNSSSSVQDIQIGLSHPVSFTNSSNEVDNYRQAWSVSEYSDENVQHWWNTNGIVQDENEWFVSRWKFNETKSFDSLRVDTNHKGWMEHKFWSGDNLSSWSGPYNDPSKAPAGKYWKVKTNLHPSSSLEIHDMSLSPQQALQVQSKYSEDVGSKSATLVGAVEDMGAADNVKVKFQYRKKGTSTWENTPVQTLDNLGDFSATITELKSWTTYEWRAFIDNDATSTSSFKVFTTTGWWTSASPSENDVRTTIDNGRLVLSGENAVGCWSMDSFPSGWKNTDNTVYDLTSLNNNGTAYDNGDNLNIVSGKWDNALVFDGVDDYVEVPDSPSLNPTDEITLMGWFNSVETGTNQEVARKGSVWFIRRDSTDKAKVRVETADANVAFTGTTTLETGKWYHLTMTYDGSTARLYLNATQEASDSSVGGSIDTTTENFYIGSLGGYDEFFNGLIDDVRIYDRALSENEIKEIYNRTKPDNLVGDDLRAGTWTSQVWDSENLSHVENLEFSLSIGTGENVYGCVGSDTDNDGAIEDNTGWTQLDGKGGVWNNPAVDNGYRFQVSYKLQTDNTTHSPSVSDFSLHTDPLLTILSVSVDNTLVDRDVDYSGSGAVDNVTVTARINDDGGRDRLAMENALFTVKDSNGTELISKKQAASYENVDENTKDFKLVFNPSDSLPNDNLGKFDVDVDVNDTAGATDNATRVGIFAVDDRETTINYSPGQMLYSGDEVTIGGEVSGFYEPVSLDNVVLKDSVDGTFQPDILGNDSWEVTYSVSQGRHEVTVEVLDKGSRLDGSKTLTFDVESGKNQPSFDPTEQNLDINLQIGLYQGKEPTKGGRIEFEPSSKFKPGDRVTVVAYLSVNGIKISHADITGSWNGSSFPLGDKKGNRFVGTFTIPKDTKPGSYLVSVDASARGLQSKASKTITVQRAKKGINLVKLAKDYWWVIVIIIILLLIVLE